MGIVIDGKTRGMRCGSRLILPGGLGYMYDLDDCRDLSIPELRQAIARLEQKKIPALRKKPMELTSAALTGEQVKRLMEGTTGNVTFMRDPEVGPPEFLTLDVSDSGDLLLCFFVPYLRGDKDMGRVDDVQETLGPYLSINRARVVQATEIPGDPYAPMPAGIQFEILIDPRNRRLADAEEFSLAIAALVRHGDGSDLGPGFALKACFEGVPEVLIGLPESDWLEVKSHGFDLDQLADKIELAQDISRFANSETGGVLIFGMRTKRIVGEDRIVKVTPVDPKMARPQRYRSVIDQRVFPPVDGLSVREVSINGGSLLVISIPPQMEASKPFLVHGAIVDGKCEGAFISIVRRRGEASIPITGPAVHAMLAAGRALFRGANGESRSHGSSPAGD